jgi:hypothetical protein
MKMIRKSYIIFAIVLLLPCLVLAQSNGNVKKVEFWGNPSDILQTQAAHQLELVDHALNVCPPTLKPSLTRQLALYQLDGILHDTIYDHSFALQHYIELRMNKVIQSLSTPLIKGMKFYKIYNDGFIVRTPSVTIAFDLNGKDGTLIPDSLMRLLVGHCDMLFITHRHDDHADTHVTEMFAKAQKKIYGPTDLWPENKYITHIRSEKLIDETITIGRHHLKLCILPGFQDDLLNNVYMVTFPEGYTVVHTGDQYDANVLSILKEMQHPMPKVDVLFIDCWIGVIQNFIEVFHPQLTVTGHENELGHTIDHREPFWLTYQKMAKIKTNSLIMSWGEEYRYQ